MSNKNTKQLRKAAHKAFRAYKLGHATFPAGLPTVGKFEPVDAHPKVGRSAAEINRRVNGGAR